MLSIDLICILPDPNTDLGQGYLSRYILAFPLVKCGLSSLYGFSFSKIAGQQFCNGIKWLPKLDCETNN